MYYKKVVCSSCWEQQNFDQNKFTSFICRERSFRVNKTNTSQTVVERNRASESVRMCVSQARGGGGPAIDHAKVLISCQGAKKSLPSSNFNKNTFYSSLLSLTIVEPCLLFAAASIHTEHMMLLPLFFSVFFYLLFAGSVSVYKNRYHDMHWPLYFNLKEKKIRNRVKNAGFGCVLVEGKGNKPIDISIPCSFPSDVPLAEAKNHQQQSIKLLLMGYGYAVSIFRALLLLPWGLVGERKGFSMFHVPEVLMASKFKRFSLGSDFDWRNIK